LKGTDEGHLALAILELLGCGGAPSSCGGLELRHFIMMMMIAMMMIGKEAIRGSASLLETRMLILPIETLLECSSDPVQAEAKS